MKELSVLQVGKYYYPYRGGFESSLYTLVNELKEKTRIRVLVSHTSRKTTIEEAGNLTIIRLANFGKIFSQPITPMLPFWMKRSKADIIHLHLPNPWAMISYLAFSPKAKLIVSYHNDVVKQRLPMFFFMPLLTSVLKRAEAIVVTSQNLIDSSVVLKKFRQKCRIIPHGIDTAKFMATEELAKEAERIKNSVDKPIILFVGRLVYYKGLKYLIRAMKDIDAHLMIVGNGPLRSRLKLLARFLKVHHKISWLGDISDEALPAYYHACDLFVLPSCANSESFGLVILEAHASGKPVISTALPTGVAFTNLHNKTGLVVSPKDSAALADSINCLLSSKELREEYGNNGRVRVGREFAKESMAENVLALYNMISGS
jgi:glycosyltransferase involved in cell wall biosynthesis